MFKSLSTSLIARGILALAVGVIALAWPSVTVLALVILFAVYAFIAAGLQAARAFSSRNAGPVLRHLLLGLVDLAAGIIALAWPGPTALVLVLIVFAVQPPTAGEGEIQAVVRRIREHALELLRAQIAAAFGDDPRSPVTDLLARFALAAIDGAFVACQADSTAPLKQLLQPLAAALAASRRALLAGAG